MQATESLSGREAQTTELTLQPHTATAATAAASNSEQHQQAAQQATPPSGVGGAHGAGVCRIDRECVVELPGGPLEIHWREEDNKIIMTGPAEMVFGGEIKTC